MTSVEHKLSLNLKLHERTSFSSNLGQWRSQGFFLAKKKKNDNKKKTNEERSFSQGLVDDLFI